MSDEMPIFVRTFDLIAWLLPVSNHFPRAHRHTLTRRLLDAAFDLRERLEEANVRSGRPRAGRLHLADEALARVRGWVNHARYGNTIGLREAILRPSARRQAHASPGEVR